MKWYKRKEIAMETEVIASCLGLVVVKQTIDKFIDPIFFCIGMYDNKIKCKGTESECMKYFNDYANGVGERLANMA